MKNRRSSASRSQSRSIIECIEPRMMLSGETPVTWGAPILLNPIVVTEPGMATPFGYTTPGYAPITPALMRDAYGLGNYGSGNVTFNGIQGTGAGQTIALIEAADDPDIAANMAGFDAYWGLPAPPSLVQLNQNGGTTLTGPNSGVIGELDLDVEWAHVMAPQASLVVYEGNNLYTAMSTAANAPGVSVISVSYGIGGVTGISEFQTPAGHAGVTFTASTGDTGGEVVDPSMSPAVVAVGGTTLNMNGTNYSSESAWADGGGGINSNEAQPTYQNGVVSTYSTVNRTVPDVALDADPNSGVAVYDIYNNSTSAPWEEVIGGTSLSSPVMAGMIAVADQGRVLAGQTTLDGYTQTLPRIYKLPAADFHDVTTGNNTHPATVGYDLATGLGSPRGGSFIPDLAGVDTVTGTAFTDVNGNGVYDAGDTALANQTVYLDLNKSGVQTSTDPTAVTNSSGGYIFTDRAGGETGIVRLVSVPAGDLHTTAPGNYTTAYDQTQTINIGIEPVSTAVVASPSTVTGTTSALSLSTALPVVTGLTYTYTWSAASTPSGATVSFSASGTAAAKASTATFSAIGSYTVAVKISDGQGSTVTITSAAVNVVQTTTSIVVTPATVNVTNSGTSQLTATAYDQFNNAMTTQPTFTWSVLSGGLGTISSNGLYSAPASGGGTATVQAAVGSVTGTSTVTVISNLIVGTSGNDVIRLVRNGANEVIFINNPTVPAYNFSYGSLGTLTINSGTGTDSVNVDFSGSGSPVPSGGLTVNSGVSTGNDTLIVTGTTVNDIAKVTATTVTMNTAVITYGNINAIVINGNGGNDILNQTAQPGNNATLTLNGGTSGGPSASDVVNIKGGNFNFAAPAAGSGVQPIPFAQLSIVAGSTVTVGTAASHADRWVLVPGALQVSGTLDLGGNDLISQGNSLSTIFPLITSAYNGGAWNGAGITSSAAAGNQLTSLGVAVPTGPTTFDGQTAYSTDVLVKYTYIGDTNLDGQVDGSDYSNIDNGFVSSLTGWSNGDLNYDGVVNGSDYTLMDNTFNQQGTSLASAIATSQVATSVSARGASSASAAVFSNTVFATATPIKLALSDESNSLFWKWYEKAGVLSGL